MFFWIQLKNEVAAKARANNEVEETHIRVETLADSLSACQWMDEHISYCRENRIHCDEDKQCCCEKCDEARYLKNDLTQCNICDGVRGYLKNDLTQCNICDGVRGYYTTDSAWDDHQKMCRHTSLTKILGDVSGSPINLPAPIKGDRLEHNGSEWTLVHVDGEELFGESASDYDDRVCARVRRV